MAIDFGDLGWEAASGLHISSPSRARVMEVLARTDGWLVATVAELAAEAKVGLDEVFAIIGPYLSEGSLTLDAVGDQIFLLPYTNPDALAKGVSRFPPNLWSYLRRRGLGSQAGYAMWALIRDLERVGWVVEVRPGHTVNELGPVRRTPLFAVYVKNTKVPAIVFPGPHELEGPDGWLSEYENAGARWVAVICREGALDEITTAVRAWMLSKDYYTEMTVAVLEEPRYNLVVIRSDDGSISPRSTAQTR